MLIKLKLDSSSKEPLTQQVYGQIRAKIIAGRLDAEKPLPSIRALAQRQNVSAITVQRAYEKLVEEGLIESRRTRGFYVIDLSIGKRRDLAMALLQDNLRIAINEALAAGISRSTIRGAVAKILQAKND